MKELLGLRGGRKKCKYFLVGSAPYITSLQNWIRSSASTRAGWSVTITKLSICVCDSSVLISALWKPPILRGNFCEIRQPACFSVLPTLYWRQAWSFPDQHAAEASLRNFISPNLLLSCLLVSSLVALFAHRTIHLSAHTPAPSAAGTQLPWKPHYWYPYNW